MADQEYSESGAPIFRHKARDRDWVAPENAGEHLEELEAHIEKHIGKIGMVWHEILSDLVHLDVLHVPATEDRPYQVLITSGVSDQPMAAPAGREEFARAELLIALPADWPISQEAFEDEANYWPLRWLKTVGRLPHEYQTWIGWGHTIPNGDPPEPIANTRFAGVMLTPPYELSRDFFQLNTRAGNKVTFYSMVPLFAEEMDFKLKHGADALEKKFEERNIPFVLDTARRNVVRKKGWFW